MSLFDRDNDAQADNFVRTGRAQKRLTKMWQNCSEPKCVNPSECAAKDRCFGRAEIGICKAGLLS